MNEAALRALLEPLLVSSGLELDSLVIIPAGRRSILRITVDGEGPKGRGPLLDEISLATRRISDELEESSAVGQDPYTLEVSSRGTSTPLSEPKHFRRNRGRLVKLSLTDATSLTARIVSAEESSITVEFTPEPTKQVKHPQPQVRQVQLDEIRKAVVQVELNRPHDPELDDDSEGVDDEPDEDIADEDTADEDEPAGDVEAQEEEKH